MMNEIEFCDQCQFREIEGVDRYRCRLTNNLLKWFQPSCPNGIDRNKELVYNPTTHAFEWQRI